MSDDHRPDDLGLFTPRSVRDAAGQAGPAGPAGPAAEDLFGPDPDEVEARLRSALRGAPPVTADLAQVIREGRARGTRIRRRQRALTVVGTAGAVAAVVVVVSLVLPRSPAPQGGPVTAAGPSASSASGTAGATRPVPSPADVGGPEPVVPGQPGSPESISVSADGRLLAISAYGALRGAEQADRVRLFDLADPAAPALLSEIRVAGGEGVSVALSPDGAVLAVAWNGGAIRLYDLADPARPRLTQTLPATTARVSTVTFSPDGGLLASGGYDDVTRLWRITGARAEQVAQLRNGPGDVLALGFDRAGGRLAVANYRTVTVWRLEPAGSGVQARQVAEVPCSDAGQKDVDFAGDRLLVADGDVRVWDLAAGGTPRQTARLADAATSLAVAPAGDRFATQRFFLRADSTVDAEVTVWSLPDGGRPQRERVVHTPIGMEGNDRGLAWLPDGSALYATTSNGGADLVAAR